MAEPRFWQQRGIKMHRMNKGDIDSSTLEPGQIAEAKSVEGAVTIPVADPPETTFKYQKKARSLKRAGRARAAQFIELVQSGLTQTEAASQLHTTPQILHKDPDVKSMIDKLLSLYELTPEMRRRVIRAKQNQLMIHGSDEKIQLDASKAAAQDIEVGIVGPGALVQVNVETNFSPETQALFDEFKSSEVIEVIPEESKELPAASEEKEKANE